MADQSGPFALPAFMLNGKGVRPAAVVFAILVDDPEQSVQVSWTQNLKGEEEAAMILAKGIITLQQELQKKRPDAPLIEKASGLVLPH